MAADTEWQAQVPLTKVERVFLELECCFQHHRDAFQALKSPQREFEEKKIAVDNQIEEVWAAYDQMRDSDKRQQRKALEKLVVWKAKLEAQHESIGEIAQAEYEKKQQNLLEELHLSIKALLPGSEVADEQKRLGAQTSETLVGESSRPNFGERESDSEGGHASSYLTELNTENSESYESEGVSRESTAEPIVNTQGALVRKRSLGDKITDPSSKRSRKSQPTCLLEGSSRTIPFDTVFDNSLAGDKETIIQFPADHGPWYIIRCEVHGLKFNGTKPLQDAAGHLGSGLHAKFSRAYEMVVQHMGIQVLDCDAEWAEQNNELPVCGFPDSNQFKHRGRNHTQQGTQRWNKSERISAHGSSGPHREEGPEEQPRGRRRGSRGTRSGRGDRRIAQERQTASGNETYIRRSPGDLCLTYDPLKKDFIPVLVLPLEDLATVGLEGNLTSLGLDVECPVCCTWNRDLKQYTWAPGYENDQSLESERHYPVLCLTSYKFPIGCPALWVPGTKLQEFDLDNAASKINASYDMVRRLLPKIRPSKSTTADSDAHVQDGDASSIVDQPVVPGSLDNPISTHEEPAQASDPEDCNPTAQGQQISATASTSAEMSCVNVCQSSPLTRAATVLTISSTASPSGSSLDDLENAADSLILDQQGPQDGLSDPSPDLPLATEIAQTSRPISRRSSAHDQQEDKCIHVSSGSESVEISCLDTMADATGFHGAFAGRPAEGPQGMNAPAHESPAEGRKQSDSHPIVNHATSMEDEPNNTQASVASLVNPREVNSTILLHTNTPADVQPPESLSEPVAASNRAPMAKMSPEIQTFSHPNHPEAPETRLGGIGRAHYIQQALSTSNPRQASLPMPVPSRRTSRLEVIRSIATNAPENSFWLPPMMPPCNPQAQNRPADSRPDSVSNSPINVRQSLPSPEEVAMTFPPTQPIALSMSAISQSAQAAYWPFPPGPLKTDLERYLHQRKKKFSIASFRNTTGGFSCPICQPQNATQYQYTQAKQIFEHLMVTHPTGFFRGTATP